MPGDNAHNYFLIFFSSTSHLGVQNSLNNILYKYYMEELLNIKIKSFSFQHTPTEKRSCHFYNRIQILFICFR